MVHLRATASRIPRPPTKSPIKKPLSLDLKQRLIAPACSALKQRAPTGSTKDKLVEIESNVPAGPNFEIVS